jgi:glutathionylspermidine synthase
MFGMITPTFEKIRNGTPVMMAGAPLPAADFAAIRRRTVLAGCKWDPQVGDAGTLADFPIILSTKAWYRLMEWSEELTSEALKVEQACLEQPALLRFLGLPDVVADALAGTTRPTSAAGRVFRFDFHYTTDGWQISEVNSDVPGGFTEASFFTTLMAERCPSARLAGNPAKAWADALAAASDKALPVALLSATGYMEDQQVMAFLSRLLRERGLRSVLANPSQVIWRDGIAQLETASYHGPLGAVARFFQGEWFATFPDRRQWTPFFRGGKTPVANPGAALISESKRFPLLWKYLPFDLPMWRQLLPETRPANEVDWQHDNSWLLKSAYCNTGDTVGHRDFVTAEKWEYLRRAVRLDPGRWLAQRRFEICPLSTPNGAMYPCLGVYTVNGQAAGVYGRLSHTPLINYQAVDAAVLVKRDEPGSHF